MKTLRKTLLLLCTLASSFGLSAQTVSGKLVDEQNQPLPYANVVLLSLPDSAFVNGTISGEDGTFTLDATSQNQIVKISSIGYKTVCKPVSPANIGIVQLVSDAQQLGEVVVKADLPKTRVKGDAMVTTVAGSILENAGTGNDLKYLAYQPMRGILKFLVPELLKYISTDVKYGTNPNSTNLHPTTSRAWKW